MKKESLSLDDSYYDGIPLQLFVTYRLNKLHAKLNAQATRILNENAGITLSQWRVMALTGGKGELTLTEIHKATQMDKGQLSRTIRSMLAEGLISAEASPSDQRQQILTLSQKGLEVYRHMLPRMQARHKMLMDALTDQERRLIFSAFDKLEIAAEQPVEFGSAATTTSSRKKAG